jgi:hypothetical protein
LGCVSRGSKESQVAVEQLANVIGSVADALLRWTGALFLL